MVFAILSIAAVIIAPRFQKVIAERQLSNSLEGSRMVLKKAQSLSSKLNVPIVVEPIFGEDPKLRVYADYWDEGSSSSGSDLRFTVGTSDRVLFSWSLQGESSLPLYFWSTLDQDPEGDRAIVGFTDNPEGEELPPLMVFSPPSGRIQDRGELSISLASPGGDRMACGSLSVITLIGQTRVTPCDDEPAIYDEEPAFTADDDV